MIKLQVTLPDMRTEIVEVESFDAQELEKRISESNGASIAIGNQLFWKIDIRHVKIVENFADIKPN